MFNIPNHTPNQTTSISLSQKKKAEPQPDANFLSLPMCVCNFPIEIEAGILDELVTGSCWN